MKFLDDILCLLGILCIVCAAFGVDWRLGFLALGAGCIVSGIYVGRFLRQNPEILLMTERKRKEKKARRRDGGSDRL